MHAKKILAIKTLSFSVLFVAVIFLGTRIKGNLNEFGNVLSANSPWIQTDWSGGVYNQIVTGNVNTYISETAIDAALNGEIKLLEKEEWAVDYNGWQYRKKINFNNTDAFLNVESQDLIDFPVLIVLQQGVNFDYTKSKDNGQDIRFADSNGNVLNYEIERWEENGSSYIWVKVPQIDQNSNSSYIYVYYGNSSASDSQNITGVWKDDYKGVWHFKEVVHNSCTGNVNDTCDSTINSINGSWTGTFLSANGKIGKAGQFTNNATNFLDFGDNAVFDFGNSDFTIETWSNRNIVNSDWNSSVITKWNTGASPSTNEWSISWGSGGSRSTVPGFTMVSGSTNYNANSTESLLTQTWNHIVAVRENTNILLYVNGVLHATTPVGSVSVNNVPGRTLKVAKIDAGSYGFDGLIDEIKISRTAKSRSWIAATYKSENNQFASFSQEDLKYNDNGYLVSNILDSGVSMDWGLLNYTSSGTGTVTVKVRTDNSSDMSGATGWGTCGAVTSGADTSANNCVDDGDRYIQYQVTLQPSGASTPVFEDISIAFVPSDQLAPEVNATDVEISGLANSGDWYATEPTITWTAGADDLGGNGILGYCIAIDEAEPNASNGLNPSMASGVLTGKNDGVSQDYCPYIVVGDQFDVSAVGGLDLIAGKQYYISIKAVDIAGNIYTGTDETWKDLLSFKYDNEAPTAPFYISLPANFLSSKDVVVTWPVGVGGADDLHSGLAGLQYRVGDTGTWYGDLHTGTEDINDLLINDGSYVTDETYDYPLLEEGNNLIYFRAIDNLGNVTAPEDYVKGLLKLNTVAPSPVRNLSVNPLNAEENAYTFNWDVPSTYTGSSAGITYCYAVNAIPSISNCTFTDAGVTSLGPDAFATQPGENTMYVVAKDEAGNINYATYSEPGSSVTYTYSGTAPGMAQNLDVADISVKATLNWRLVLSWDRPDNVGAGIAYYNIYRSETASSCSSSFTAFIKVGSSTSTSYIDPDLQQKLYNYCIKACDSANNCSASSGTVGRLPTGKFTEPAELLSPPEVVSFTTRKAVINWITDRVSDSSIQYGLDREDYFEEEISNSLQIANHTIALNNLQPGTTYFYRAKWTDVDGNIGVSEESSFATLPAPVVSNVKVSNIGTTSALVSFLVENTVEATIRYGLTQSYGGVNTIPTSQLASTYTVPLTGLVEGSLYNFNFELIDIEGYAYSYFGNNQFNTIPFPRVQDIQVQEVKNSAQPTVDVNWISNVPVSTQITYYPLDNTEQKRDKLDTELKTEHETSISELQPNRRYGMIITGRDAIGNQAESDEYQFTTAADSRPPSVSNIKVETRVSNTNTGEQAQTQLIVTWDTDEEATSQIEYGEGSGGTYTQRSLVDDNLTFNHLVIVNNLRPSSVYHFRVVSADSAGNESSGKNVVTITAQVSENPLDIIISRLTEVFGFIR